ncbi:hypothetical protein SBV1_2100008 [Verrucomicrobia bacterium]|nr:hypothetical protein SBV1_2100008 [Verrucomicrobiota bacterium]
MELALTWEKSLSLADLRQQERELEARIFKLLDDEPSSRFLDHVRRIVEVVAEDKELELGYIPLVRTDYIIRDVLRTLKNSKGTPQDVDAVIGDVLTPILEPWKDSLAEIRSILADGGQTTGKDANGNTRTLRPLFKANGDGSYSALE